MTAQATTQTPIKEFESHLAANDLLFVVFYRGHWCPFCRAYLKTLQSLSPSIESVGGKTLIVTSQPAAFLPQARELTTYSGAAIIDTENTLVVFVKERYGLEIAVSEKDGYEHGMIQPAILVLRGGKSANKGDVVLEKWAIVPSVMNIGGATDRPDMEQVWENVKSKIEGKGVVHKEYTKGLGFFGSARRVIMGVITGH